MAPSEARGALRRRTVTACDNQQSSEPQNGGILPVPPCRRQARVALALSVVFICVSGVSHWVVSDDGRISPAKDFPFLAPQDDSPFLPQFIEHEHRLSVFRSAGRAIDRALMGKAPDFNPSLPDIDLLSKMRDISTHTRPETLDFRRSLSMFLAHKGIRAQDVMQLTGPVKKLYRGRSPVCDSPLDFRIQDFHFLEPMMDRNLLQAAPEKSLLDALWLDLDIPAKSQDIGALGARLAMLLAEDERSWPVLLTAAAYWRIKGNQGQAVECYRRALSYAPRAHRDLALTGLAASFLVGNYSSDALTLADVVLETTPDAVLPRFLHGCILSSIGDHVMALEDFKYVVSIQPDLMLARQFYEAASVGAKLQAVADRRDYEINLRKLTMVLTPDLTWDAFDYEAIEDPCADAICKDHAECSNADGRCHCVNGWRAKDGECVKDEMCEGVVCRDHSVCRAGHCYCEAGFMALDGVCVSDPCAGVTCVDNALCNSTSGRCECVPPYIPFGGACVSEDCQGISCRQHAFCQHGLCYCRVGYKPDMDLCLPEEPCVKSRCPQGASCDSSDGHCRCDKGFYTDVHNNKCLNREEALAIGLTEQDLREEEELQNAKDLPKSHPDRPGQAKKAAEQSSDADKPSDAADFEDTYGTVCESIRAMGTSQFPSSFYSPSNLASVMRKIKLDQRLTSPDGSKLPFCRADVEFSSLVAMDHIESLRFYNDSERFVKYTKEIDVPDIFGARIGREGTTLYELGERVSDAMKKEPTNPALLNLASFYWRWRGVANETLHCTRLTMHVADQQPQQQASALVNAVNVLRKAELFDDALRVGKAAVDALEHKDRFVPLMALGQAQVAAGDYAEAFSTFQQCRSISSVSNAEVTEAGSSVTPTLAPSAFAAEWQMRALCLQSQDKIDAVMAGVKSQPATGSQSQGKLSQPVSGKLSSATTEETARHKEQLQQHVREAKELQLRLQSLKRMVEQHSPDDGDVSQLRKQLREAEKRLETVFVRQRLEAANFEKLINSNRQFKRLKSDGNEQILADLADIDPTQDVLAPIDQVPGKKKTPAGDVDDETSLHETVDRGGYEEDDYDDEYYDDYDVDAEQEEDQDEDLDGATYVGTDAHLTRELFWEDIVMAAGEDSEVHKPDPEAIKTSVQSPQAPDVAGLVRAVKDMLDREGYMTTKMSFDDPKWPPAEICAMQSKEPPSFTSTWISPAEQRRVSDLLDVYTPIRAAVTGKYSEPVCDCEITSDQLRPLEKLPVVAKRDRLQSLPESSLRDVFALIVEELNMAQKFTIKELAHRMHLSLMERPYDWKFHILASLYWRLKGKPSQAMNCLIRGFIFAEERQKTVALVSMGNVAYTSGYTVDAITLEQMAIQLSPKTALAYFTLGNVLLSLGTHSLEEARFFFETAMRLQPNFDAARPRLEYVACKLERRV